MPQDLADTSTMLIAYFDESGHSRQTDFVSMAACVGRYDQWKTFDQQWNAALAKHNAPYLHMREYAHSIGPFEGWKEPQRRGLMADCLAATTASRLVFAVACVRVTDFITLEPEIRAEIADPYYACFQELVSAMKLAAYVGFPGDHVNIVYSQQDEFGSSFRKIFELMKKTTQDGERLGVLALQDMRSSPGLQLADLVASEMRHYYPLRQDKPHLAVRYPFRVLCEHQLRLKGDLFKFIPQWLMRLKITGGSAEVLRALFRDPDTWAPLIRQLAPEPINLLARSGRLVTETPSHREVLLRVRFPDLRGAQAATGRSRSDPITQSFGCSSTLVRNAFSSRARFENSAAVYTVGFTCRPRVHATRSSAPKTSPYVRLSLTIITSMSLPAWSVALATDPYTKAARIAGDKGFRASRSGSASPTVFKTIFRSSENSGDAAFA